MEVNANSDMRGGMRGGGKAWLGGVQNGKKLELVSTDNSYEEKKRSTVVSGERSGSMRGEVLFCFEDSITLKGIPYYPRRHILDLQEKLITQNYRWLLHFIFFKMEGVK